MARDGNKKPPTISDVIYEVQRMDHFLKGTSEYNKAHKDAVSVIELANSHYGPGWTSISKTRSLLQSMRSRETGVFTKKKEDKK